MLATTETTILVAKNRGLIAQASRVLDRRGLRDGETPSYVRGEDVGQLANATVRAGRDLFAVTGDDLLDDWLAAGNELDAQIERQRVRWSDPYAIYGKPALCLIAPPETRLDRGTLRVAICSRYANLAEPALRGLEQGGTAIVRTYCEGALEAVLMAGMADAIVDIVVTGASIVAAGLSARVVLYTSDLAVLVKR